MVGRYARRGRSAHIIYAIIREHNHAKNHAKTHAKTWQENQGGTAPMARTAPLDSRNGELRAGLRLSFVRARQRYF